MAMIERDLTANEQELWRLGVKVGISRYAVWKDGKQYVGVMERPLHDVLREVDKECVPVKITVEV